jgi:STAM-binding protein
MPPPPPRTIQQLTKEANSYEFLPSVSFRSWLHVCKSIIHEADIYKTEGSNAEAYLLYSRFAHLVLYSLVQHPALHGGDDDQRVRSNRLLLKTLIDSELERVMNILEGLKPLIEKEIEEYSLVEEARKARIEALQTKNSAHLESAPVLRDGPKSGTVRHEAVSTPNQSTLNDVEFMSTLSSLKSLGKSESTLDPGQISDYRQSISYPPVPQRRASWHLDEQPLMIPEPPELPTKVGIQKRQSSVAVSNNIEHRSRKTTEGGQPLRTIFLPLKLRHQFLDVARANTNRKLETAGILCGKLSRNAFFVTDLVIPHQLSTSDTCTTTNEEVLFEYIDQHELFILGWIHTHPTQSCFLSSIDLHTQNSYQIMLPEAVAIVCAPQHDPAWGIFRLTDPPGMDIIKSCKLSGFHPHDESDVYTLADNYGHVVLKDLPFETKDLRNFKS